MSETVPLLGTATQTSFSWTNLVILAIVAVVVVPLLSRLRATLTRNRRERWAREEGRVDMVEKRDGEGAGHSDAGGGGPVRPGP